MLLILPVIFVGHRVVKGVPYNSFVVNYAYLFEFRAILGHLSDKGEVFRTWTINCKKGSDWLTSWVETQHNIYVVKSFQDQSSLKSCNVDLWINIYKSRA